MKYFLILLIISSTRTLHLFSQNNIVDFPAMGGEYPIARNDAAHPCITLQQYKTIEKRNVENCKSLGLPYQSGKQPMSTAFIWPLKAANGLNDGSYFFIINYLDHNGSSSGILDWNCGSVTYDGHRGTDICTFPYPFHKMDNNQVEVIAAASGTIINKADGHYDKNCSLNDSTANYIVIQHADGSCAMYWHLKKHSLTSKTIGQTVVAGEYLGIVGSSGNSTGPHLHFEVLSGVTLNTLIDTYAGPCNSINSHSWWANQKPYTEPAVILASVHPTPPVFPPCPATETPNDDSCFTAGNSARFYTFYRNETTGLICNMRIINPDGSTFVSWTHHSTVNHLCSYWFSTKTLPTMAGTYKFEAEYNGNTCTKPFKIVSGPTHISEINESIYTIDIYPNPFSHQTVLHSNKTLNDVSISFYNEYGQLVKQMDNISGQSIILYREKLLKGLHFVQVLEQNKIIFSHKLIIID